MYKDDDEVCAYASWMQEQIGDIDSDGSIRGNNHPRRSNIGSLQNLLEPESH
jgi:hypothetical protein